MTDGKIDIGDLCVKITNAHIARAMTSAKSCHYLLRHIYDSKRELYFDAADKSPYKSAFTLAGRHPEYPFIGFCALGVLEACSDYMKLQELFRACDSKAFDRMIALGPPVRLSKIFRIHIAGISKLMSNRILILLSAAKILEYEIDLSDDASQCAIKNIFAAIEQS